MPVTWQLCTTSVTSAKRVSPFSCELSALPFIHVLIGYIAILFAENPRCLEDFTRVERTINTLWLTSLWYLYLHNYMHINAYHTVRIWFVHSINQYSWSSSSQDKLNSAWSFTQLSSLRACCLSWDPMPHSRNSRSASWANWHPASDLADASGRRQRTCWGGWDVPVVNQLKLVWTKILWKCFEELENCQILWVERLWRVWLWPQRGSRPFFQPFSKWFRSTFQCLPASVLAGPTRQPASHLGVWSPVQQGQAKTTRRARPISPSRWCWRLSPCWQQIHQVWLPLHPMVNDHYPY